MTTRVAACLGAILAAVALAGCGGAGDGGRVSVWVTRDDGRSVLIDETVPSGLTALQAVDRVADIGTRYGGRYLQSVDGLEGSLDRQQDWFLYVNGYEADRGGAELIGRDGDIVWWDFHDWSEREAPLVAGAYPEPFLHGHHGERRPVLVLYESAGQAGHAVQIGRQVAADEVRAAALGEAPADANVISLVGGPERLELRFRSGDQGVARPGAPVVLTVGGPAVERLAADPAAYRFRYAVGVPAEDGPDRAAP